VGFKCQKCFGGWGFAPDSTGGVHDAPQISYLGVDRRGSKGLCPPKPWIKKIKLSCRIMHIDALAVAVINDHKQLINIAAFHHLRHITTQKSVQLQLGGFAPDP